MGVLGWGRGGETSTGPSRVFSKLPFQGFRDWASTVVAGTFTQKDQNGATIASYLTAPRGWFEEFVDAVGVFFDIVEARFASAQARARFLDPTYSPVEQPDAYYATATAAPLGATIKDSMVDLLCYIALGVYPLDSNLTIAQKQALAAAGGEMIRRKGNRIQILRAAAIFADGVVAGWSSPPWSMSVFVPDGTPSPGWGSWVPASGAAASFRPWVFAALSGLLAQRLFPAWSNLGVGFSQFRAGYSAIGEPALSVGATLNVLASEHFSSWSMGLPTGWTVTGPTARLVQDNTYTAGHPAASVDFEFTKYCATIDYQSAQPAVGSTLVLSQSNLYVNNQLVHRLQLDYAYRGTPAISNLVMHVRDESNGAYWNPSTQQWTTAKYDIPVPPAATATTRTRFAFDIVLQSASSISATVGTSSLTIDIGASYDGTTASQLQWALYRVGLYEKFNLAVEQAAGGERTAWFPLVDALGWCVAAPAAGSTMIEPATADRSSYKLVSSTGSPFPYHVGLGGRGYQSNSTWTDLLKGTSALTGGDWSVASGSIAANQTPSPQIGDGGSAPKITASTTAAGIAQTAVVADPHGKTYCGGVWAKKLTADANQAGTITVTAGSNVIVGSGTSFAIDGSWAGALLKTAGGHVYRILSVSDNLHLTVDGTGGFGFFPVSTETGVSFQISDIVLTLSSTATHRVPYFLSQSQGWQLLPFNAKMANSDVAALNFQIFTGPASAAAQIALSSPYLYDVTANPGVLYPPVCQTAAGATGTVGATLLTAKIAPGSANLHPLLLRGMTSVAAGALNLTIVPTFDGTSQPSGTIFDFGQDLTHNRVALRVNSGNLEATVWDNAGTSHAADMQLTVNPNPSAGSMTWLRDTPIAIRLRWSSTTGIDLAAGNGSQRATSGLPWTTSDAALAGIGIGNNFTGGSGQFDGLITGVELIQIGGPLG